MRKFLKGLLLLILVLFAIALAYILIYFPGVMTGMDAKVMCSCRFVAGRSTESVLEKELQVFPGLTWADFDINDHDSTVSASLLWKTSKAIFRKGLGCTLLSEISETEVRNQKFSVVLAPPPGASDSIPWPMGNKVSFEHIAGVDYVRLKNAVDMAFVDSDPENPVNTHAVVVLYNGQVVAEQYADGFNYKSRLMGWSMTKSIGNALVGILVKQQKLKLSDSALMPEWANDQRNGITVHHLLQASSGLKWNESYFVPTSDFHEMFIRRDDKGGFAASLELDHEPGTVFEYSSGSSNILARLARERLGQQYHSFPYLELFHKVGMYSALLEVDASGTFVNSSYGYASARDWARLGLLYMNDGVWEGDRILPEGWVGYSTEPAPAAMKKQYGAQIWLNRGCNDNTRDCFLPGVPPDAYFFEGFERNSVTIIPSRKLVIVRLGVTHNRNFDLVQLISGVMASVPVQ